MKFFLLISIICTFASGVFALSLAPKPSLEKRVGLAKLVFVGKVVNRKEKGEWIHAELLVEESIVNIKSGARVPVIWRKSVGGYQVFDAAEGLKAIAILNSYHEGRYWLRSDTFENLSLIEEVRELSKPEVFDAKK